MKTIGDLSSDDKPREKLLHHGSKTLSNAELLAILIGSGSRELNAVDLCRQILNDHDNDLEKVAQLSVEELTKFNGIGEAKAISIISALEIGRRRQSHTKISKPKITCSYDAYNQLHSKMMDLQHEELWILCMNRSNEIIKKVQISIGGMSSTTADPKVIFRQAVNHKAQAIILAHNHPSGSIKPSKHDRDLTDKIKKGGLLLEIPLLDHIIYTNNDYFSFSDEQMI